MAAQSLFWKYLFRIFGIVSLHCIAFVETMSILLTDSLFGKVNRKFLLQALEAEYRGQVEEMKKRLTSSKSQMVPGDYPHQTEQGGSYVYQDIEKKSHLN